MLPSVTIAIPVYNEERYIEETILSALKQTYGNLKIVISDNCSQDRTFEIIQQISANHSNILAVKHDKNIGAAENFRYALKNCNTDFFSWLGGHDLLDPLFIEKAVNAFLADKTISLVYPRSEMIDVSGKNIQKNSFDDLDTTRLNDVRGPLKVASSTFYCSAVNGLFRTSILKKYDFKEIVGVDHLIIYHASLRGKIFFLEDTTNLYRVVRKETTQEALKRYESIGLTYKSKDNPYSELSTEYLKSTFASKDIPLVKRIRLLMDLPSILQWRFNYQKLNLFIKTVPRILKIKSKFLGSYRKNQSSHT